MALNLKWPEDERQKQANALQIYMAKQEMENRQRMAQQQFQSARDSSKEESIWNRMLARENIKTERDAYNRQQDQQFESRKVKMKELSKNRQALDLYASDANQALGALGKIEREAKNLGDFDRGLLPQLIAKGKMGIGKFSKDKGITRYMGVVSQELIPMARKLMEEKGPITEWDVARVERGLGDMTAPLEDKMFLLDELRGKVKQALQIKMKLAELGPQESGKYNPLLEMATPNRTEGEQSNELEQRRQRLRQRFLRGA